MSEIIKRFITELKCNKIWRTAVFLEIILLCILFVGCFRSRCDYTIGLEDLSIVDNRVTRTAEDDGTTGYYINVEESLEETDILKTENICLHPGAYRMTIYYYSQVNDDIRGGVSSTEMVICILTALRMRILWIGRRCF